MSLPNSTTHIYSNNFNLVLAFPPTSDLYIQLPDKHLKLQKGKKQTLELPLQTADPALFPALGMARHPSTYFVRNLRLHDPSFPITHRAPIQQILLALSKYTQKPVLLTIPTATPLSKSPPPLSSLLNPSIFYSPFN